VSRPPVEVCRGTEVVIPQSCCTFAFASTPQRLHETFLKYLLNAFEIDKHLLSLFALKSFFFHFCLHVWVLCV